MGRRNIRQNIRCTPLYRYTPNSSVSTASGCCVGNYHTRCCSLASTLYCSTIFFWFSTAGTLNMVMRVMRRAALRVGEDMLRYLVAKIERIAN